MAEDTKFRIRLEGFAEAIFAFRSLANYLEPNGGILTTMQKAMSLIHIFAIQNVHIITGALQSSLHFTVGIEGNNLIGSEMAAVPYDIYEFTRPGTKAGTPHNTLVFTQAHTSKGVNDLFQNDLNQQVTISTRTTLKS